MSAQTSKTYQAIAELLWTEKILVFFPISFKELAKDFKEETVARKQVSGGLNPPS